jgi:homeobox protein cut-like
VEFAGLEDPVDGNADDDVHLPDPNAEKANSQHGKSLEILLATKNKRILEELTKFRVRRTIQHTPWKPGTNLCRTCLDVTM